MKKTSIAVIVVILSFAIGFALLPKVPQIMSSHWNYRGEADGIMTKGWALFLMPSLMLFMLLLFVFLPRIDPLKENIGKFRKYYDNFILIMIIFFFYVYVLTLAWNLGERFNMSRMFAPAFAFLFYYMGNLLQNSKPNWFVGIRTPWTMSSAKVWETTHSKGAKLFKGCALISLLGMISPEYSVLFILLPVLLSTAYLVLFSYFEFKKEKKTKKK